MYQERWNDLAEILVSYSGKVKQGDKVYIAMVEVDTFPLAKAVYSKVVQAGGLPFVEFQSVLLERELMLHGSQEQLDWITEPAARTMEWADVYIGLRGNRNPYEFTGFSPSKIQAHKRSMGHVSAMRTELSRWVLIRVPNESFAQQAEISTDEMMDFFFSATLKNWHEESKRYREIQKVFECAESVHVLGDRTDLRFSTKGRKYMVGDGTYNMPDGEIYTSPVDDSAEGKIYFEFPGIYSGQKIQGISLEFSQGILRSVTSDNNHDLLDQILHMDEGARRIGEFGVGTNFGINRFCSDILFDEKIGGTIHVAMGRAYTECGGVNQSALHWDLIKDLRQEGEVYLDGVKVIQKGKFLI